MRGRGIDKNAMRYILDRHSADELQFIDGWTGKGAILNELSIAVDEFIGPHEKRLLLGVLSDPANITDLCGTHDDFPIASSFLNAIPVSDNAIRYLWLTVVFVAGIYFP